VVFADAAVSDQAAAVRAARCSGKGSDRLHAGSSRRGEEGGGAIKLGPLFTPPIVRGDGGKTRDGVHRQRRELAGGSYDPDTGIFYVFSNSLTRLLVLANEPKRSDMDYINTGGGGDSAAAVADPAAS
jgi:hypothetical protein